MVNKKMVKPLLWCIKIKLEGGDWSEVVDSLSKGVNDDDANGVG